MKTKPILFSGPMVNAILDGRKTQTRRQVKFDKHGGTLPVRRVEKHGDEFWFFVGSSQKPYSKQRCKFGKVGDLLWVRENFSPVGTQGTLGGYIRYKADSKKALGAYGCTKWKPSIFMPKSASRITLKITDIRVERLQDISENDASAEGCNLQWYSDNAGTENLWPCPDCGGDGTHGALAHNLGVMEVDCNTCDTSYKMFKSLWNSINKNWDENPWVWCITFEVLHENVNSILGEQDAVA